MQRVGDDDISLEVAPGIELRVAKRAVAAVVSEPEGEDELEDEDEQAEETSGEPAEATDAKEEAS